MACNVSQQQEVIEQEMKAALGKIKHKLLIMSGKGGVGKSTVATNLAVYLSDQGYKVGLMDVDIHGPSVSGLLGLTNMKLFAVEGGKIQPFQYHENLKVVSVQGFLDQPDTPIIWRGAVKMGLIGEFLSGVEWGDLDFLVIDCPPGTGDEPLTVVQKIEDCKAVIVTTPQEIALADVRKSINFCAKAETEIAGLVENMSGFVCPDCGSVHNIFKSGGGIITAAQYAIPFLGSLPIDPQVVANGDEGRTMLTLSSQTKERMGEIVKNLLDQVNK